MNDYDEFEDCENCTRCQTINDDADTFCTLKGAVVTAVCEDFYHFEGKVRESK